MAAAKAATVQGEKATKSVDREEKVRKYGLPHVHVANAWIKKILKDAQEKYPEHFRAVTEYVNQKKARDMLGMLKDVRYARISKGWDTAKKHIEICIFDTSPAYPVLEAMDILIPEVYKGHKAHGLPPPGHFEKTIQEYLDQHADKTLE